MTAIKSILYLILNHRGFGLFLLFLFIDPSGTQASGPAPVALRQDQVFFDTLESIAAPVSFNWYFNQQAHAAIARFEDGARKTMWEPLFFISATTGKLDPWLALSLEPNGNFESWTLVLRKEVRWSDNKPFQADDVVFTVDMALDTRISLPAIGAITIRKDVKSVRKGADDFTVEFTLNAPNPRFDIENFGGSMSSSFLIMPKHEWKNIMDPTKVPKPWDFKPQPIGTGAYKYKTSTDKRIVWELDENWWGEAALGSFPLSKPLPRQIVWQVVDNIAASKSLLVKNDLDVARDYTREDFADVRSKNAAIKEWGAASHRAWSDPCPRQLDINLKHRRGDETESPWHDPTLRKALSLLIDRTALTQALYGDTSIPSRTMFTEQTAMEPYIDAIVAAGYGINPTADAVGADALLTSAGYAREGGLYKKHGGTLSATILVDSSVAKDVDGANEITSQLQFEGIDAKVETVSHDEFWADRVAHGRYEMAYSWLSCGSRVEPYTSMSRYVARWSVPVGDISPGFSNTGRWDTQAAKNYTDLVAEMSKLRPRDPKMKDRMIAAYKYLAEEMPFIPLVQSPVFVPFNTTYWTGWAVKGGDTTPWGDWASTYRMINELKRAH